MATRYKVLVELDLAVSSAFDLPASREIEVISECPIGAMSSVIMVLKQTAPIQNDHIYRITVMTAANENSQINMDIKDTDSDVGC